VSAGMVSICRPGLDAIRWFSYYQHRAPHPPWHGFSECDSLLLLWVLAPPARGVTWRAHWVNQAFSGARGGSTVEEATVTETVGGLAMADELLVGLGCGSTGHPQVGRFVWDGTTWRLVAASRQRPGSILPSGSPQEQHGSFDIAASYPGCPSCGAMGFVRCGRCTRLACWDSAREIFECPACGNRGPVTGTIESISTLGSG
jgi:predicted RNA-binding Zn-ribbon protein involved in translation (DUF1610 family)